MSYQPGQFPYPPNPNIPPRPTQRGLWGWYKSRSRKAKIGFGCGTLIAGLVLFSCIGAALGSSQIAPLVTPTAPSHPSTVPSRPALLQHAGVTNTAAPTTMPTRLPTKTATPPPPQLTPPAQHTATPCPGINCNPWGYNFSPGNLISDPPSNFCSYFNCITSFWERDDPDGGYVVQCVDGTFSQSGGERGACSYHGGVSRPLYSH